MSTWSSPPTVIAGTTILAAVWNAGVRDLENVLRSLTGGDPSGVNLALISIDASSSQWIQVPNAAIATDAVDARTIAAGAVGNPELAAGAAVANLGYPPVSRTGDAMTAKLSISAASGTGNNFNALDLIQQSGGNSGVYLRFMVPSGAMTLGFFYGNSIFQFLDTNGTNAFELRQADQFLYRYGSKVWDAGNDGTGSGLDADLWRGLAPAAMLPVIGTYAGDSTVDRTITLGFQPSYVLIVTRAVTSGRPGIYHLCSTTIGTSGGNNVVIEGTVPVSVAGLLKARLVATGFLVDAATDTANNFGATYSYIAHR